MADDDKQYYLSAYSDALKLLMRFRNNPACMESTALAVGKISSAYKNGGKAIIAGNGGSMCDAMHFAEELTGNEGFLNSIDGLGRENLWFQNNVRVKEEESSRALKDLLYAKEKGKFVFAIDYSVTEVLKNEFLSLCATFGLIPYAGTTELDSIE